MITDKQFDSLAQNAHVLGGILAVVAPRLIWGMSAVAPAIFLAVFAASVKEFWFDERFETAEVRGSSPRDFAFYCIGILVGTSLVLLAPA